MTEIPHDVPLQLVPTVSGPNRDDGRQPAFEIVLEQSMAEHGRFPHVDAIKTEMTAQLVQIDFEERAQLSEQLMESQDLVLPENECQTGEPHGEMLESHFMIIETENSLIPHTSGHESRELSLDREATTFVSNGVLILRSVHIQDVWKARSVRPEAIAAPSESDLMSVETKTPLAKQVPALRLDQSTLKVEVREARNGITLGAGHRPQPSLIGTPSRTSITLASVPISVSSSVIPSSARAMPPPKVTTHAISKPSSHSAESNFEVLLKDRLDGSLSDFDIHVTRGERGLIVTLLVPALSTSQSRLLERRIARMVETAGETMERLDVMSSDEAATLFNWNLGASHGSD